MVDTERSKVGRPHCSQASSKTKGRVISFWFQKNKYLLGVRDEATLHFVKSEIVRCYGCSRHGVDIVRCQGTQPTYTSCPEKQNGWLCINILSCTIHSQQLLHWNVNPPNRLLLYTICQAKLCIQSWFHGTSSWKMTQQFDTESTY